MLNIIFQGLAYACIDVSTRACVKQRSTTYLPAATYFPLVPSLFLRKSSKIWKCRNRRLSVGQTNRKKLRYFLVKANSAHSIQRLFKYNVNQALTLPDRLGFAFMKLINLLSINIGWACNLLMARDLKTMFNLIRSEDFSGISSPIGPRAEYIACSTFSKT